jgi:hypothetical protein
MKNKLTLVLVLAMATLCRANAFASIQLTVNIAPPPIAVFDQPACPGDGYIWTPGQYQYGDYGYYFISKLHALRKRMMCSIPLCATNLTLNQ